MEKFAKQTLTEEEVATVVRKLNQLENLVKDNEEARYICIAVKDYIVLGKSYRAETRLI